MQVDDAVDNEVDEEEEEEEIDVMLESSSDEEETKRCARAEHSEWFPSIPRVRPVSRFNKDKSSKDGLQSSCKQCTRYTVNQHRDKKRKEGGASPSPPL